ncbi:MAG: hypothetical protein GC154_12580 [bacterium]|nr:hypothetical protein [bacterium]
MKTRWILYAVMLALASGAAVSQTLIGPSQIEDVFLRKSGGSVFGDVAAATSTIQAATLDLPGDDGGVFTILRDGPLSVLRSDRDIYIDPTNDGVAGGQIIPATVMKFPEALGDKIRFYSTSYKIGVSPFDLDITSDRNIRFHSDTVEDLMVIAGDEGDVTVKNNLTVGNLLQLKVVNALPSAGVGQIIYLDHTSDDGQDGVYVMTGAGWQKL